jgi:hypothetical protein
MSAFNLDMILAISYEWFASADPIEGYYALMTASHIYTSNSSS